MTLVFAAKGFFLGGRLDAKKLNDRLNELGGEGWELVSIFDTNMIEGQTKRFHAALVREWRAASKQIEKATQAWKVGSA